MFNKKLLKITTIISFCVFLSLSLSACQKISGFIAEVKTGVEIQDKNYDKAKIEETKEYNELENQKDYTKDDSSGISLADFTDDEQAFINLDKTLTMKENGETKTITYRDLAKILDKRLVRSYKDYYMEEELVYNFSKVDQKSVTNYFLTDKIKEEQKDDEFYRDATSKVSDKPAVRTITAVTYKDKENEEYTVGTFTTKEEDTPVELVWKDALKTDNTVTELLENDDYDFSGIDNFYYYNSINDFKVRCKAPLSRFKDWLTIDNAGTKTLKNVSAKVDRDTVINGEKVKQETTIKPLETEFYFSVKVENKQVTVESNLTQSLKTYYTLFNSYNIEKAVYKLSVNNIANEEKDGSILEDFGDMEVLGNEEDMKKETESLLDSVKEEITASDSEITTGTSSTADAPKTTTKKKTTKKKTTKKKTTTKKFK